VEAVVVLALLGLIKVVVALVEEVVVKVVA
jgi:hypothetical protein